MKQNPIPVILLAAGLTLSACNGSSTAPTNAPAKPATASAPDTGLPPGHPPLDASGASTLPPGHPPMDMSAQTLPAGAMAEAKNPKWTVPEDWKPGKTSSMRRGSFSVAGADNAKADIAVTVFPGDVGGLVANVNRWRGQLGLPAATADEIKGMTTKVDCIGTTATIVDITSKPAHSGKGSTARMIVATVPEGGNTWFIKLTGESELVGAQKENFVKFVQSLKF